MAGAASYSLGERCHGDKVSSDAFPREPISFHLLIFFLDNKAQCSGGVHSDSSRFLPPVASGFIRSYLISYSYFLGLVSRRPVLDFLLIIGIGGKQNGFY
jgi:hypothetical protein